jgi:hypothetical protein
LNDEGVSTMMDTVSDAERREFLKALTLTTAALVVAGCGGGSQVAYDTASNAPASNPGGPTNQPPVWQTVPTITFTQGVAQSISIAAYVSDPNGDPLTITKNTAALPAGITYDQANKRFVYDGVGAIATTNGHILTASDGKP